MSEQMSRLDDAEDLVVVERDGVIGIVKLNSPALRNAINRKMREELTVRLRALNEDPACRAIVLTGTGKHFSAGADLKGFNEDSISHCRSRLRNGPGPLLREMVTGPKPLIAAVEGYAYGAGMALAAACDYVVVSSDARFCCAFTRVALIPDLGLFFTLPQRVGAARAKRLILSADEVDAAEAEKVGLVDRVVEPGTALEAARAIAKQFSEGPPLATEFVKHAFSDGLEDYLRTEVDLQSVAMMSEDFREGIRSFYEKRRPVFIGR
ncbi:MULTISPECIES: enoyl-CoA hydratase/isomerase family protein [unclassified Caballeronia]|uniref:enoyl-CoA hydratase/isomerase family protein n=1 Tax=unclassified Caballeronia TaxID=2646786 RepID=UPI00285593A1|nr:MULTISPECIES: enoyl-CoA hydratase/isomerase family protein [unclassified Caballeronia]MDR5777176.1 enoyl-CoA hydratase/isomerase family protein [Caballeronia sp. LZ002]MDR5852599.1 enoyl-CoA hydratase/isomerase family protein [Caballeronia sp. LZ003]